MKNIVGPPARKNNFYPREREIERIIARIEDGNNINIAAPRRIGKTSILYYLLDNKINHHIYVFADTEAVDDEQAFFKKLLKEIVKVEEIKNSTRLHELYKGGNKFFKKIKSLTFLGHGIEFQETKDEIDYKQELENLLSGIDLGDTKLILMIDEFPQTVQNIVAKDNDVKAAVRFLQANRELRLNPDINQKVIFVYSGSIGLNHTVAEIDGSAFINDINTLEINALTETEAIDLFQNLLNAKKIKVDEPVSKHLIQKIEWLIPFHIQLAAQEIITISDEDKSVTKEKVDLAFDNIIAARNNNHFDDYYKRLKKHFKNEAFSYAVEVLNTTAENETYSRGRAADLAIKYKLEDKWRHIIEVLMYDGYINDIGNKNIYRFNSPILRMWWQRFICK